MKIYGPYKDRRGRQKICIVHDDGKKTSISYPKWLMEQKLGRKLDPYLETIDHIDGNFNNNSYDNLRILPKPQHSKEDVKRAELITIVCVWCGKQAQKKGSNLRHNAKLNKAGPFCSRSCAGKYGVEIQNKRTQKIAVQPSPASKYYTLKDKSSFGDSVGNAPKN